MIDKYVISCSKGDFEATIYFDMYHPGAIDRPAPKGMTRSER